MMIHRIRTQLLLPVFTLILAIVACQCQPQFYYDTGAACAAMAPANSTSTVVEMCVNFVQAVCPIPSDSNLNDYAAATVCLAAAINAYYNGTAMPSDLPGYTGIFGDQPSTPTPTPLSLPQPPAPSPCTGFRVTSPLDGLPNGSTTFYWDPVFGQGATYEITMMDENRNVLAVFPAGTNTTNFSADVSQGAIGGMYTLYVRIRAYTNNGYTCQDEHLIMRAAANLSMPTATPRRRS